MQKGYYIIAHNGVEIIDNTPEAEIRLSEMDYIEERIKKEQKMRAKQKYKFKNLLYKLVCMCGIGGII